MFMCILHLHFIFKGSFILHSLSISFLLFKEGNKEIRRSVKKPANMVFFGPPQLRISQIRRPEGQLPIFIAPDLTSATPYFEKANCGGIFATLLLAHEPNGHLKRPAGQLSPEG